MSTNVIQKVAGGFSTYSANPASFTVGSGQQYSSVVPALEAANLLPSMTNEITTDCSSVETNASATLDKRLILSDSGTGFDSFNVGQLVGVEIGGSGCPILGIVVSNLTTGELVVLLRNPILTDLSATSCVVGIPSYKSILVAAGHIETLSDTVDVGSFTTVEASTRGTTRLEITQGVSLFVVPATSNETKFKNLGLNSRTEGGTRLITYSSLAYEADTYVENLDGYSSGLDGIYFGAGGSYGGFSMRGCYLSCGYDVIRLGGHREVNVFNNVLEAFTHTLATQAQASVIAIGVPTTLAAIPVEKYNLIGNTFKAFGQDLANPSPPTQGEVRCVDIRNKINSNALVNIQGNHIYATGDDADDVFGVKVGGSSAGETPTITVTGNTFDIRNNGAGNAYSMDSDQANYTIDRAGNVQINGIVGANTAAATIV